MVSVEIVQASEATTTSVINEQPTSPRISFSSDFLDESNFISITPQSHHHHHHHHDHHPDHQKDQENEKLQEKGGGRNTNYTADFEFLSNTNDVSSLNMSSADELFFEGKLLPFWQMPHPVEKLNKISLKSTKDHEGEDVTTTTTTTNDFKEAAVTETRVSWFVDDDPSPRPPKCTVLWKELLRLRKQRASSSSSLSPSSSSSSTSSSRSSSLVDIVVGSEKNRDNNHVVKRIKKGLERTRSASIRIRPMVNVPICTQQQVMKSSALPPLFPLKKGRWER